MGNIVGFFIVLTGFIVWAFIAGNHNASIASTKHAPDIVAGQIQAYVDLGWTCYVMREDGVPSAALMVITVGCKR